MTQTAKTTLRAVLYEDEGFVIAQCLEYDIGGHGDSEEAAIDALKRTYVNSHFVAGYLGVEPFAEYPPAPDEFWKMWEERCATGKLPHSVVVPERTFRIRNGRNRESTPPQQTLTVVVSPPVELLYA